MKGLRVDRRWGWDCHGLPVEYEMEKEELGMPGKRQIEEYGVAKFNEASPSPSSCATPASGVRSSPAWGAGSTGTTTTRR